MILRTGMRCRRPAENMTRSSIRSHWKERTEKNKMSGLGREPVRSPEPRERAQNPEASGCAQMDGKTQQSPSGLPAAAGKRRGA